MSARCSRSAAAYQHRWTRSELDGVLTMREKLVILGAGKVTSKIRDNKRLVEEAGQLSGEIDLGMGAPG